MTSARPSLSSAPHAHKINARGRSTCGERGSSSTATSQHTTANFKEGGGGKTAVKGGKIFPYLKNYLHLVCTDPLYNTADLS